MIGCIIQARMGSTRLPGKVLKKLDEEKNVLNYIIEQLSYSKTIQKIIIATSKNSEDKKIVEFCKNNNIEYFIGSEKDVLDRHYQCAKKFRLTEIIRIPSDKPLIDPFLLDRMVKIYLEKKYDYVTNFLEFTFPFGTEIEIFSFDILCKIWNEARLNSEREHVTPYIYKNPKKFKIFNLKNRRNMSQLRWELDREEDLFVIRKIIKHIKKRPILIEDVIELSKKEPKIFQINKNINPLEGYLKSLNEDENEK